MRGSVDKLLRRFLEDVRRRLQDDGVFADLRPPYRLVELGELKPDSRLCFIDSGFQDAKSYRGLGVISYLRLGAVVRQREQRSLVYRADFLMSVALVSMQRGEAVYSIHIAPLDDLARRLFLSLRLDEPLSITRTKRLLGIEDLEDAAAGVERVRTEVALLVELLFAMHAARSPGLYGNPDLVVLDGSLAAMARRLSGFRLGGVGLDEILSDHLPALFSMAVSVTKRSASSIVAMALRALRAMGCRPAAPLVALPERELRQRLEGRGIIRHPLGGKDCLVLRAPMLVLPGVGVPILDVGVYPAERPVEELLEDLERRALEASAALLSVVGRAQCLLPAGAMEVDAAVRVGLEDAGACAAQVDAELESMYRSSLNDVERVMIEQLRARDSSLLRFARLWYDHGLFALEGGEAGWSG